MRSGRATAGADLSDAHHCDLKRSSTKRDHLARSECSDRLFSAGTTLFPPFRPELPLADRASSERSLSGQMQIGGLREQPGAEFALQPE